MILPLAVIMSPQPRVSVPKHEPSSLHTNKAEASFRAPRIRRFLRWSQCSPDMKLSAESHIRPLLKAPGWDNLSLRESSNKPKPPLQESDVANLFNLAAGLVENAPEHEALKVEQGFGYPSAPGEVLFACVPCRPDIACSDCLREVLHST